MDRRSFIKKTAASVGMLALQQISTAAQQNDSDGKVIKVGVVGVGSRGTSLLHIMTNLKGCQITALCDIVPEKVERAKKTLKHAGHGDASGRRLRAAA